MVAVSTHEHTNTSDIQNSMHLGIDSRPQSLPLLFAHPVCCAQVVRIQRLNSCYGCCIIQAKVLWSGNSCPGWRGERFSLLDAAQDLAVDTLEDLQASTASAVSAAQ
eukprot:GHUV01055722.1.p1 GENE.GHUV01055722.1~~GHUV01055722.1.p1  ORF type:complete len:125 (-),score=9.67 GHUV01055722.1:603-923(-)